VSVCARTLWVGVGVGVGVEGICEGHKVLSWMSKAFQGC